MTTLNELTARIVGWAQDRNLIEGSTPMAQTVKLGEELGETFIALCDRDRAEVLDGHGDMYVVATILCAQLGSSIIHPNSENRVLPTGGIYGAFGRICAAVARKKNDVALEAAWDFRLGLELSAQQCGFDLVDAVAGAWEVIKDRKGRMVDGVFIKEGENG